jgi:hypothetical protein
MTRTAHRIYIGILVTIVLITLAFLIYKGISYYSLPLEERVYHSDHTLLKPSGTWGHGMGIIGSFLMIIGMASYMVRKRYRFLSRVGILKHWLEFHIFLCTLGPILVLFHTAYKFGGLVAISFWSMVAVFASGIIGRFIYIQIPHTNDGRELSINEVRGMKSDVAGMVRNTYNLDKEGYDILDDSVKRKVEVYQKNPLARYIKNYLDDCKSIKAVKKVLKRNKLAEPDYKKVLAQVKDDIMLNRRIERLESMRNLFKYWHVAHLPFAMVMLIIMIIHVGVTILFGYRWIF